MSVNTYLIDASTRHQVFLQRYAGGRSKEAYLTLNRLRNDIKARISREPTEFQAQRLQRLLDDIEAIAYAGFDKIWRNFRAEASDLAQAEAEFAVKLYDKTAKIEFTLPSDQILIQAVENAPISVGGAGVTVQDAFSQLSKKKTSQITQMIRDGIALGDDTPRVARKIGEVMNTLQRRQLDTIVRTAANSISSAARTSVYTENSELLDGYEWVSTLDSRTSLICQSRDGQVYQTGMGPMPPAHWGCRSTTVPVVKPEYSLARGLKGTRPSVGAEGAKEVSAKTTYGTWLKKQSKGFIDEALGVERSELFRAGKLTLDKFVDPTGRVYTLEELHQMNPFVFQEQ
jgi:SPP1 gp7 family putative phage head morphogenesis protein